MNAIIQWIESSIAAVPLGALEIWGKVAYVVGIALAVIAFAGVTLKPGGRWGLGLERQAWDAKAVLAMPVTFILIIVSGYLGSSIVLVPEAQTFESLKDLIVLVCILVFGRPALITVPFAYGLSDLIEGVPPEFVLDWLPGYFINPACFWIAYLLIGRDPDFRRPRTWAHYVVVVVAFLAVEPMLWGHLCADQFTAELSYRSISSALFFTTGITWILAPVVMLVALPAARRLGVFWAQIPGHVRERARGATEWRWVAGAGPGDVWPIRLLLLAPFITLVLVMVGATSYVSLRSARADGDRLATQLHREIADNIRGRLDDHVDNLGAWLRTLPVARHGAALVVDRAGRVIGSSADAHDAVTANAVAGLVAASWDPTRFRDGVEYRFDQVTAKPLHRETWLARATSYRDPRTGAEDWLVLTVMPESFYQAGVQAGSSRSAMIFALALLVSLVVSAVLAASMARRLQRLSVATRALAMGNLDQRVPSSRLEELDSVAASFNDMAERLQMSFDDLRRTEEEHRKSEERYRTLLDTIMEGGQLLGFDWRYLYLNPAAEVQNRRPNAELLGQRMQDMWPGMEQTEVFAMLGRTMTERVPQQAEVEFVFADGDTGWFDVRAQPVPEGVFILSIDITERRTAEREVRALNEDLERKVADRTLELAAAKERAESADRLKSAFLATMSHELRTPLNSIIGFTGILLQQLPGPVNVEQSKQLGMVQSSARHLLELINDVLDISKIEAGELKVAPASFDLRTLIERAVAAVRPIAEAKHLALSIELAPSIGEVVSDARRVNQILLNLLNNAVKFSERGSVTLIADVVDARVRVRIIDTGIGIKPEDLARLFRPFQQVESGMSRRHDGTGLGLVICRRLADLLGGEILVESEPNHGSTFTLMLPLFPRVEP